MIFIDGTIVEVGLGECGDGVQIEVDEPGSEGVRSVTIVGLSRNELRAAGRMLYERVSVKIESKDERARSNEEQPKAPSFSNVDEATGIKKTGEI